MNAPHHFVFLDPSGRRWPRVRIFFLLVLIGSIGLVIGFIRSILLTPALDPPPQVRELKGQLHALEKENPAGQAKPMKADWLKFYKQTPAGLKRSADFRTSLSGKMSQSNFGRPLRVGFYVDWDPDSYDSLAAHASELTHIVPEWLYLRETDGVLVTQANSRVSTLARAHGLTVMPLLSNLDGETWQPEAVENLALASAGRQDQFIYDLLDTLHTLEAGGVVLDWQKIDPAYQQYYTILLHKLALRLHEEGLQLWVCVPASAEFSTLDLGALADSVDHFVAMLYDETSQEDPPGPIASQDWFEGWLHVFMGYGDPSQWIICLGAYGYDWSVTKSRAEPVSFIDAMARGAHAGVHEALSGAPSYNPHFAYEAKDTTHYVWFLDTVTFLNQWQACRDEKVGGIGLFRLGSEDPSLWYALVVGDNDNGPSADSLRDLEVIRTAQAISHIDEGEFISVDLDEREGHRNLKVEGHGRIATRYQTFPLYPTLYHQGEGTEHEVALSFDDGPDPRWTPAILAILKRAGVKAVFFVTGQQAERYPDLVRQIVQEGHEIGNHTYSHPNLSLISAEQVRLELNATQRIIEAATGRSTTLFRPPYNADSRPHDQRDIQALDRAQDLGYITVCENIDPEDWARPGASVILQRIREQRQLGNIVLLHDAGGDRSQTVAALPGIIDYLHSRGDEIVSLGRLLGVPRDQLMPAVNPNRSPVERFIASTGFGFLRGLAEFLWSFMIFATVLLFLRTLVIACLCTRYCPISPNHGFSLPVSVLVAAYNEEKVIAATLRSILASDYPAGLEVIVVDDGSSDQTLAESRMVAAQDARVKVHHQNNLGKSVALREALDRAAHPIVVFLDADTQLESQTLQFLAAPFVDPRVGAVSGHAKVGNLRTLLARCQALEYTCGFNFDRRAYDVCNSITVVPGAISAARVSTITAAGGLSDDTLAEDTDLTLTMHRLGVRIVYAERAIAWTEAPENIRALARQRFRWAFGTLQCLWKHRDLVFSPDHGWLGWFSLPGVWFFQIILVALAPLVDLLLLIAVLLGTGAAVLPYFLCFLILDLLLAGTACLLEKEPIGRALYILPLRVIYRPLLTWVLWAALTRAIKGASVGWGKLDRTASVNIQLAGRARRVDATGPLKSRPKAHL